VLVEEDALEVDGVCDWRHNAAAKNAEVPRMNVRELFITLGSRIWPASSALPRKITREPACDLDSRLGPPTRRERNFTQRGKKPGPATGELTDAPRSASARDRVPAAVKSSADRGSANPRRGGAWGRAFPHDLHEADMPFGIVR
jgi:hypothetical protein